MFLETQDSRFLVRIIYYFPSSFFLRYSFLYLRLLFSHRYHSKGLPYIIEGVAWYAPQLEALAVKNFFLLLQFVLSVNPLFYVFLG